MGAAPAASQLHPTPLLTPFPALQRHNPPVPPLPPPCHHRVPQGRATAARGSPQPPPQPLQRGLSWWGSPPNSASPVAGPGWGWQPRGGGRGTTPVSYIPRAGSGLHNSRAAVSALLSASATGRAAAPSPSPWIFAFWGQAGGRGTPAGWLSCREWPGAGGSGWQGWLGLRLRGLPQAPPVSDLGARIPPGWKHPVEGGVGDGDSRDGPVLLLRQRCSLLHPLPPTVLPLPSRRALCRWGN